MTLTCTLHEQVTHQDLFLVGRWAEVPKKTSCMSEVLAMASSELASSSCTAGRSASCLWAIFCCCSSTAARTASRPLCTGFLSEACLIPGNPLHAWVLVWAHHSILLRRLSWWKLAHEGCLNLSSCLYGVSLGGLCLSWAWLSRACGVSGERPANYLAKVHKTTVWRTCSKLASRDASSLCNGSPSLLVRWPPPWCSRCNRPIGSASWRPRSPRCCPLHGWFLPERHADMQAAALGECWAGTAEKSIAAQPLQVAVSHWLQYICITGLARIHTWWKSHRTAYAKDALLYNFARLQRVEFPQEHRYTFKGSCSKCRHI